MPASAGMTVFFKFPSNGKRMKRYSLPALLALLILNQPVPVDAAEVTVRGGLTTGFDLYDRNSTAETDEAGEETGSVSTELDDEEDDYQRVIVQPLITIDRETERSFFSLSYRPGFYYDFESEDDDAQHQANLDYTRSLTKNWKISLNDSFLQADDASEVRTAESTTGIAAPQETASSEQTVQNDEGTTGSDDEGRRKYITNSLQLLSDWAYRKDSQFALGYGFGILRNDEDETRQQDEDYDRHDFSAQLGHRLSQKWKMSFVGQYVLGLYDEPEMDGQAVAPNGANEAAEDNSDDVSEYYGAAGVEYNGIARHPLLLNYGYRLYDYVDETEGDTQVHDLTFGWKWLYSPHLTYNLSAGPSYAKTDGEDDTWGGNGEAGIDYTMEWAKFNFTLAKGLERQNFTGETDNNGLIDYWDARASYSRQLLESTTFSLFAGYRYEDQDELTVPAESAPGQDRLVETINSQVLYAGCGLQYSFWKWYALDLSYRYGDQTSDDPDDEYDEHTVMLRLSFTKDFWRW
jgi:opacity protein-like surface antigen